MTDLRLAHMMIFAKHMAPMTAFYRDAFELTPEPSDDPGWLVLKSPNGAGIALHALPPHIAADIEITTPPTLREDTAFKICFEVPALAVQRQRVLDHGGSAKEPWEWQGTRFCECADPEGNVIQIFERGTGVQGAPSA